MIFRAILMANLIVQTRMCSSYILSFLYPYKKEKLRVIVLLARTNKGKCRRLYKLKYNRFYELDVHNI